MREQFFPDVTKSLLSPIFIALKDAGMRPLIVGGAVRDFYMGLPFGGDIDVEIFGATDFYAMRNVVSGFGEVKDVGEFFGVTKMRLEDGTEVDFTLARKDHSTGAGHTDFTVYSDGSLTPDDVVGRRDFTMNALYYDLFAEEIIDLVDGRADINFNLLRMTSEEFRTDPLRVLRGARFCSRFGIKLIDSNSLLMCQGMFNDYHALPKERIWGEWEKILLSDFPSQGLRFLHDVTWLNHYPELALLPETPQSDVWHQEGSVFTHTCMVVDAMAEILSRATNIDKRQKTILMLAALCHDLGKGVAGVTFTEKDGRIVSPGHAEAGITPTETLLERLGTPVSMRESVYTLVAEHMAHIGVQKVTPRLVRRLMKRLDGLAMRDWAFVVEADMIGRIPVGKIGDTQEWLRIASELNITEQAEVPIVTGKDLIDRKLQPGPWFKHILDVAYEAQMDGELDHKNKAWWLAGFLLEHNLIVGVHRNSRGMYEPNQS